jgi:hypothetical protein
MAWREDNDKQNSWKVSPEALTPLYLLSFAEKNSTSLGFLSRRRGEMLPRVFF